MCKAFASVPTGFSGISKVDSVNPDSPDHKVSSFDGESRNFLLL